MSSKKTGVQLPGDHSMFHVKHEKKEKKEKKNMKIRRTVNCYTVNVEVTKEDGVKITEFLTFYCRMKSLRQIEAELEMRYGRSDGKPVNYHVIGITPTKKIMEMDVEKFIENAEEVYK